MNDRVNEELLAEAAGQHVQEILSDLKVPVLNFMDFISDDDGTPITDTLKVSVVHGKRHDNIVQLVRKRMKEAGNWGVLNFKETLYVDAQNGQAYPMFTMTKSGYQFLVAKMTGKKSVEHQIAFIEAFDAMAKYIKNQREGLRFRFHELELDEKDSKRRGSYHGKGLNTRRREKTAIKKEQDEIESKMQPRLDLDDPPADGQP